MMRPPVGSCLGVVSLLNFDIELFVQRVFHGDGWPVGNIFNITLIYPLCSM